MVGALIGGMQEPSETGVHYLLLEACVTFLSWDSLFPVPPRGEHAAQLMSYLVCTGTQASTLICLKTLVQRAAKTPHVPGRKNRGFQSIPLPWPACSIFIPAKSAWDKY